MKKWKVTIKHKREMDELAIAYVVADNVAEASRKAYALYSNSHTNVGTLYDYFYSPSEIHLPILMEDNFQSIVP